MPGPDGYLHIHDPVPNVSTPVGPVAASALQNQAGLLEHRVPPVAGMSMRLPLESRKAEIIAAMTGLTVEDSALHPFDKRGYHLQIRVSGPTGCCGGIVIPSRLFLTVNDIGSGLLRTSVGYLANPNVVLNLQTNPILPTFAPNGWWSDDLVYAYDGQVQFGLPIANYHFRYLLTPCFGIVIYVGFIDNPLNHYFLLPTNGIQSAYQLPANAPGNSCKPLFLTGGLAQMSNAANFFPFFLLSATVRE
jgi:hypothetical protein